MKKKKLSLIILTMIFILSFAGCTGSNTSVQENAETETALTEETLPEETLSETETSAAVTAESETETSVLETVPPKDVVEEGMVPVYGNQLKDGSYSVQVDSSSSMFRITECTLVVEDGNMQAAMTMGGTGYLKVYMGTGEEAQKADEQSYIPYVEQEDGTHSFTVPVEALDMGINCAAFSKNKEAWYDRVLVFRADSLPVEAFADGVISTAETLGLEDGSYSIEVSLSGGSGKSSVESPAKLQIENGAASATIVWSSSNYDYMKVNDEKFEMINTEGNSTFTIPVLYFDRGMAVIADTIAMSQPHEIEYTLTFHSDTIKKDES